MDRSGAQSRAGTRRREPLGDGAMRANIGIPATPPQAKKSLRSNRSHSSATSSTVPHHESLSPNGTLTVRNDIVTLESPNKLRSSAVPEAEEEEEDEDKRASQLSASSQGSNWGQRKRVVGQWLLGKDIGRGMVGRVRKVKHVVTGELAAAKIIPMREADAMRAESLMNLAMSTAAKQEEGAYLPLGIEREVVIMRLLSHRNIVKLYDIWENRGELYIIMELVEGGELFEYVTNYERLEEDEAVWIFRQIVVALLSAHRLGIYHRDLKPENILINHVVDEETGSIIPEVKLVDFGMAALQPKGKLLTTSCGSIHYAAPEVFEKRYDGGKADVWSLGVILYVVLTGMLPFTDFQGTDYQVHWYHQIKSGRYDIPDWVSQEAQDLIRRMLVPDPRHRISLANVWLHPLLDKWRDAWGEPEEERDLTHWLGVKPAVADWAIKNERDIDKDIFRGLRVLWHSEKEENLKKRLLSSESNFEKYFYLALAKHREEQQENFVGNVGTLNPSASDHHHMHSKIDAESLPPLPPSAYQRTKSSLSIMHDDLAQAKPGTSRKSSTTPSQRSYDPYRSSRNPIVSDKEGYSVTVHRSPSGHRRHPSSAQSMKTNSLRVETLRKEQNRISVGSGSAPSRRTTPSPRSTVARRSISRTSIGSSAYPSSLPGSVIHRPISTHRRGVDFSHVRRSSTTSALSASRSPSRAALTTTPRHSHASDKAGSPGTHKPASSQAPGSRSSSSSSPPPPVVQELLATLDKVRLRKSKTHSQVIDSEARKVSTELEKFCEEAFNRESTASSYATTTATTRAESVIDTPPSSISYRGSTGSSWGTVSPERESYPVRESSRATPNTQITHELAMTRKNLAERYGNDKSFIESRRYREVMASLDYLLSKEGEALQAERRVVSAPEPSSEPLPMISEEERVLPDNSASARHSYGAPTPVAEASRSRITVNENPRPVDPTNTIRVIEPSSPPATVAPLNIRKTSTPSPPRTTQQPIPAFSNSATLRFYNRFEPQQRHSVRRMPPIPNPPTLAPISEGAPSHAAGAVGQPPSQNGRRHGWFGGWKRDPSMERTTAREASLSRIDPSRRPTRQASAETDLRTRDASLPPMPPSPRVALPGKRPGFLSLFTRKKAPKPLNTNMALGGLPYTRARLEHDTDSVQAVESESQTNLSTHSSNSDDKPRRRGFYHHVSGTRSRVTGNGGNEEEKTLGIQRNWLERFFNIKPAAQAMCFRVKRQLVRKELVKLLRGWYEYGIRDVLVDKERNLVFARVAAENYLRIKEVSFVIQLFVVLEHGRHNNLSVARFVQRKGAASSFRVAVGRIETVMQKKGFTVVDEGKRKEMEEMVGG